MDDEPSLREITQDERSRRLVEEEESEENDAQILLRSEVMETMTRPDADILFHHSSHHFPSPFSENLENEEDRVKSPAESTFHHLQYSSARSIIPPITFHYDASIQCVYIIIVLCYHKRRNAPGHAHILDDWLDEQDFYFRE